MNISSTIASAISSRPFSRPQQAPSRQARQPKFGEYNGVYNYEGRPFVIKMETPPELLKALEKQGQSFEKQGQAIKEGLMAIAAAMTRKITP